MKRATDIRMRVKRGILAAICLAASMSLSGCVSFPIDVKVEAEVDVNIIEVNGKVSYSIVVSNNSPAQFQTQFELIQTFSLPVEVLGVSSPNPYVTCTRTSESIICEYIPPPDSPDSPETVVNVLVRATTPGTLTSTASLRNLRLLNAPAEVRVVNPGNDTAQVTTRVAASSGPDLSVSLTDNPDPASIGGDLTYTAIISNIGTETAAGVILTDTLPAGVIDITPGQAGCARGGDNTRVCDLGSIPSGESRTMMVVVAPTQEGPLTNHVVVTTTSPDPDSSNNIADESTTVTSPGADLAVTMTDGPDPAVVGENVTYRVNVTNNGPTTATNILLTDFLPANADLISITPGQGSCSASWPVETCGLGSLGSGASASLTVVVSPREAGTLTHTANVMASEVDPLMDNNSATESTTVNEALVPNLSVTVSDSPDPVVVNQPLTYTISVRNNGLGAANGFLITATLPPSITAGNNNGFTCSPDTSGNLVCQSSRAGLPSGGEASYSLVVTPTATGTIANTVNVTPAQTDADPADNTFTENTIVSAPEPTADVSVAVSDSPDPVAVNQSLTYTITFTNNGLATATGIVATVTLPPTVNTSPLLACTPADGNTVCQLSAPFSLSNGESIAYPLRVTPTAAGTVTVVASALATEDDPDKNNNTATETTTVSPPQMSADLEVVSVTDTPDPAVVNDQFIYTITVRNNGLSAATGVVLSNTLSERVVSDGGSNCPAGSGPVIQCPLGNMSSGSTQTIFLRARSSATGTVTNTVSVSAQETDPDTSNNLRSEETIITPSNSADVSVSLAAQPNPVTLPANVTFTIVVQNTGPQAAGNIVLTDFNVQLFQVPELLNISSTQGTCSLNSFPLLTCNLGTLANNSSATVTITGRPLPGTFTRAVTAGTSTADPNLANNNASISVVVN